MAARPAGAEAPLPRRYGRALLGWVAGAGVPPLVAFGLLAWAVAARCGPQSVDCSWGFEFLLVLPVLGISLVSLGPLAVYVALRLAGDPLAGRTAGWTVALVLPGLVLSPVSAGLGLLVLPPVAGRYLALRGDDRVGRAAP